ncbi:MAG: transporter substrate-binding domain-containing protein [Tatlockia sp.]|nr:transporter substrate-binding domain-containing protein [Tatlockia sp.]
MKFRWLPLLFSALASLFLPANSQAQLRIGVMFYDPPLVMSAIQGFHVDFANRLCKGLQETCTIVPMEWNRLFVALDKGEIDLIMGVFYTIQRAQKYLFSMPYKTSRGRFLVRAADKISNFEDLKGRKLGILQEEGQTGVFSAYLRAHYLNFFKVVEYKDINMLVTALDNKSIKAALFHARSVNYWADNSSGILLTLGPAFKIGEGYTLMALPERQDLINRVNQQITQIKTSGDFARLYSTFWGDEPES